MTTATSTRRPRVSDVGTRYHEGDPFAVLDHHLNAGRAQDSKSLGNNTAAHRFDYGPATGSIGVRLHATDVVVAHPDGSVTLNSGGYRTVTTKDRINRFLPKGYDEGGWRWTVSVFQRDYVWYIDRARWRDRPGSHHMETDFETERLGEFHDGIVITADGRLA